LEKSPTEQSVNVFVIDNNTETTIYKVETKIYNPVWSGDGKEALFTSESREGQVFKLKTMDIDTKEFSELPQPEKGIDIPVSKSPDNMFLSVRNHTDVSDYLAIIRMRDFSRHVIKANGWAEFIAWLPEDNK